ncbi:hypothetical protein ONR75_11100 [Rhodopseudomonas sp. P2A-2r]|uniref:hypothetical protein n=1 Tax=Rhodopseudomonas sp. P2A-2r TaxID=2991972 RepID=UPI002233F56D|nr:hypothetical protein [Rhodopseudomonas sp. P2A-2r]UZE51106.1 hypothetical protein ONR75_11100 [Rhodopseudomonas sp. P2A-2r]
MNMRDVEAHPLVREVMAKFPGAAVAAVCNPLAPIEPPGTAGRITFGDLWIMADNERQDAERACAENLDRARESDQRSEAERDTLRRSAGDHQRRAALFDGLARMVERARTSPVIQAELARMARQDAHEAAERAAEALSPGSENNAS